jgi:UDP-N-acetylmuramoylalanine--D-glutamate ligase
MVKRAYIIGVEAESISKQLECESVICENMKKAVEQATEDSSLGDVVLLAPAASSFDQYENFERRGEDFIFQVERVIEGAKKSKTV